MARIYRKHRYHGIKLYLRRIKRSLVNLSRSLVWILPAVYLLLPWLLPLGTTTKVILMGIGIISLFGAGMWQRTAQKVGTAMDILASGHDGEGVVAKALARMPREWAVLNDLALRAGGPIVQIDHIVITPAAIHILETKAQKGQIIVNSQGKWQVKRNGEVRSIVNPVEQNRAQVKACQLLLGELKKAIPCHGMVVMTESTAQANWPIVKVEEAGKYLLEHTEHSQPCMNSREIRKLARALLNFQVKGKAAWEKDSRHLALFALTVLTPLFIYVTALVVALV